MPRDAAFDESHPFYPRPSSNASPSLVEPLSFLLFHVAPFSPLPMSRMTLSSSLAPSSRSSHVVLDYTMKPLVTQVYSHRGAHLSNAPSS
jgi:hypothetical protein